MKFVKRLILAIILIITIIIASIVCMGHSMYTQAINKTSISSRVETIKNSKNYTNFNDISDNFKNAIVAVEDHRFYSHGGIDFITTMRSMLENIKEKDIVAGGSTITQQVRTTFILYTRTALYKKNCRTFCCI